MLGLRIGKIVLGLGLVPCACGPGSAGEGGETETGADEADSTGTSTGETGESGTSTGETGETTSADTGETGEPGGVCDPLGNAYAAFDLLNLQPDGEVDWELSCELEARGPADGESGYLLTLVGCTSLNDAANAPSEVELFVDSNPSTEPFVEVGGSVHLRWVETGPWVLGRYFTLRADDDGGMLYLAGADGDTLVPPDFPDFFAPLLVEASAQDCVPIPAQNRCAEIERVAVELGWDGVSKLIFDSNFDYVGPLISYLGVVERAQVHNEVACPDYPGGAYDVLFFLIPEG